MTQAGDLRTGPRGSAVQDIRDVILDILADIVQDEDPAFSDEVIAAVDSGNKIDAIKRLREETGLDLREAKTAVDALARDRRGATPQSAQLPEEGGVGGVIRLVVLIAAVLAVYFYFFAP